MPLLLLLLSVSLSSPFGTAEAEATDVGLPLQVAIVVEVDDAREAVLARIVTAGGELDPVAMVSRHDGTWGATVRLSAREDVLVAFEALAASGDSAISEAHRLSELGVDPAIFAIGDPATTAPGGGSLPEGAGWLALAAAAAVLAVALVVVGAGRGRLDTPTDGAVLSADPEHPGNPDNDDSAHR